MVTCAPRLSRKLIAAIGEIDNGTLPIAEVNRRVGARADRLGLPRPSYERVRQHVKTIRRLRRLPSTASVLVDVAFRARPIDAVLDQISGVGVPQLPHRFSR